MKSSQRSKTIFRQDDKENTTKKVEHKYNKMHKQIYETEDFKN
jgi:hypothetical protein